MYVDTFQTVRRLNSWALKKLPTSWEGIIWDYSLLFFVEMNEFTKCIETIPKAIKCLIISWFKKRATQMQSRNFKMYYLT